MYGSCDGKVIARLARLTCVRLDDFRRAANHRLTTVSVVIARTSRVPLRQIGST